jgi:Flp pilus assembly protein TadG
LRTFLDDRRAAVAIIVALIFPVIFGIAALTIDIGHVLYTEAKLQAASDAAALAAASSLNDEDAAVALAQEYAGLNMPEGSYGTVLQAADVVFGTYDTETGTFTADDTPTDAVRVTLNLSEANGNPVTLFFANLIGFASRDVQSQAIATQSAGGDEFCFFATETEDPSAFKISGTVDLDLGNCGIAVASTDDTKSLEISGSSVTVAAGSICVAGGYKESGSGVTVDPTPEENCADIPDDPLAGLTAPTAPATADDCDEEDWDHSGNGQNVTLSPGTYCGGIQISGNSNTITFEPGVYILAGGGLKVSGGSNTLQNDTDSGIGGVMFFNTESEPDADDFDDLSFSGDNDVNLSAPTSGDYAGVLFFQDPDSDSAESSLEFSVSGTVDMQLDGTVYMPDHLIDYSGTSSTSMKCTKLIGNTIEFSGTSGTSIPESCASDNVSLSSNSGVRLRG